MAVYWHLKTYLAKKHGIFKAVHLQKHIVQKTGVLISTQNLCNLLNKKPSALRLKTIEILCTSLECKLEDFCSVGPRNFKNDSVKKLSAQTATNKAKSKTLLPDPKDYE